MYLLDNIVPQCAPLLPMYMCAPLPKCALILQMYIFTPCAPILQIYICIRICFTGAEQQVTSKLVTPGLTSYLGELFQCAKFRYESCNVQNMTWVPFKMYVTQNIKNFNHPPHVTVVIILLEPPPPLSHVKK